MFAMSMVLTIVGVTLDAVVISLTVSLLRNERLLLKKLLTLPPESDKNKISDRAFVSIIKQISCKWVGLAVIAPFFLTAIYSYLTFTIRID